MLDTTFLTNLDQTLFHYINSFCGQSLALDHIANRLESSQLKGLAFCATFGALWFQRAKNQVRQHQTLVLLLVAIVVSLVVARICADLLPFRERPMFRPDIGYQAPLFHQDSYFEDWSSFPSDNAALLFVMTTGFWLVSTMVGPVMALFQYRCAYGSRLFRPPLPRRHICRSTYRHRNYNRDQQRVRASAGHTADTHFREASARRLLWRVISVSL
jgi:hypothetical protein